MLKLFVTASPNPEHKAHETDHIKGTVIKASKERFIKKGWNKSK